MLRRRRHLDALLDVLEPAPFSFCPPCCGGSRLVALIERQRTRTRRRERRVRVPAHRRVKKHVRNSRGGVAQVSPQSRAVGSELRG